MDGPDAKFFATPIDAIGSFLVPTISLYEVFKRILQQRGEGPALQATALMHQGALVDLSPSLALSAARVSLEEGLPMADAIMLATARSRNATLWTQDADFARVGGVKYVARRGR